MGICIAIIAVAAFAAFVWLLWCGVPGLIEKTVNRYRGFDD